MNEFQLMNETEAKKWLEQDWSKNLEKGSGDTDPEIDAFVNSSMVSLRYCFITQLLGKVADQERNLHSLQAGDVHHGSWNPRSFATAVIVPWVGKNHNVLGTSQDPYVSKPLRQSSLEDLTNVKKPGQWNALRRYLSNLNDQEPKRIEEEFRRCLRSVHRKLESQ